MKKRFLTFFTLCLMASVLSSCGKSTSSAETTKKDDNTYTYEQVSCDDNINRFFPERYYLLPIPVDELQNNPLCENNAPW